MSAPRPAIVAASSGSLTVHTKTGMLRRWAILITSGVACSWAMPRKSASILRGSATGSLVSQPTCQSGRNDLSFRTLSASNDIAMTWPSMPCSFTIWATRCFQPLVVAEVLELDEDADLVLADVEQLAERRHALVLELGREPTADVDLLELGGVVFPNHKIGPADALEVLVVNDHDLTVTRFVDVDFDPIEAVGDGLPGGGERVFGRKGRPAAVGGDPRAAPRAACRPTKNRRDDQTAKDRGHHEPHGRLPPSHTHHLRLPTNELGQGMHLLERGRPPRLRAEASASRSSYPHADEMNTRRRPCSPTSPNSSPCCLEAREERQLLRLRGQLGKLELLVLDELGYVPAGKAGAELLFDVIANAYERHSVIVTTNLPFENWTEVLSSERLTGAALDRLTHRCHILETKGETYRLAEAKQRRRARHHG